MSLENIGWGSPLDKFIVKLQTLSPGRRHWTISPARQHKLLSSRQSCLFTMAIITVTLFKIIITAGREWFKFYTASPNLSDLSIYWHDRAVWAELCSKQEVMHDAQKPIDPSLRLVILAMLDILLNIMHDGRNQLTRLWDQYEIEMPMSGCFAVLTKKLHNVLFHQHQQHHELIMS